MGEIQKKLLQWHPAFYAGIQIELEEEAEHLIFENEHMLSSKPMQIDVLIIKKNTEEKIRKNIGQIFRKHNIIEYKSPDDYLGIDDYYKVYGYTYFYKSDTGKANEIKLEELTISLVCNHYPRKLMKHLKKKRNLRIEKQGKGIYYIIGETVPVQLIITKRLSEEENLWLKSLTNDLSEKEVKRIIHAYEKHEHNELYKSAMDVIVRANENEFKGAKEMCDALLELMKDELDEQKKQGIIQGERQKLIEQIQKKITKGKLLEQIADELEETVEVIAPLYDSLLKQVRV